ncbi:hypothetical protein GOP47_0001624 [Adiantum capillus-veneris]|uniref:RRM domain-containing protein n=1 Tax=Adiantum capillus-veneris TaxID=13818 RepID=A0A9D4ZQ74_ADICA|nr:hypothetical protein GOP47_0001624 [Adiantum capillus-veneris]
MATISLRRGNARLPPEVNRVLYVRNLPFNITSEEMYDIFGKYGAIRQIRVGTNKDTRGTAFVVKPRCPRRSTRRRRRRRLSSCRRNMASPQRTSDLNEAARLANNSGFPDFVSLAAAIILQPVYTSLTVYASCLPASRYGQSAIATSFFEKLYFMGY